MTCFPTILACACARALACVDAPLFGPPPIASSGARFFPATLATDDPCVADEMSLPTVAWSRTGDVPPAKELDISGEISKRITEDFGVSIGSGWTHIRQPGGPDHRGFR